MTGHRRPTQPRCRGAQRGEEAVSPVVGAILILAITVLGIAGVLFWGAPMIDRIQAQNAQAAMVGEFEDLRDSSRELSVPDHSRFPTVILPRGELLLEPGSRMLVAVGRDPGFPGCDLHVRDWADSGAGAGSVTVQANGCRGGATLTVSSVSGATLVQAYTGAVGAVSPAGADFSEGDWLFRLSHASCPGTLCAEAWLHSGDQVTWRMEGSAGVRRVSFDSGAIFSSSDGALFLEREPTIGDVAYGAGYYGFWLRSLDAAAYIGLSGDGSHQVYLALMGTFDRVDTPSAHRLRFDISGDLAEAWCNSLRARTDDVPGSSYEAADPGGVCAALDASGVRSVCFARVASGACSATSPPAFTFRFLHARIHTSLVA